MPTANQVLVPDYHEAQARIRQKVGTALDVFVVSFEPDTLGARIRFRSELNAALLEVKTEAQKAIPWADYEHATPTEDFQKVGETMEKMEKWGKPRISETDLKSQS